MDKSARLEIITERLKKDAAVEVSGLASVLSVSEMTVRRDLERLEAVGLCRRVHGGAVAVSGSFEPIFSVRQGRESAEKQAIGARTAQMIPEGSTVFIDVGSTTLEVARALRGRMNLTILTPSLRIATTLADEPGLKVICLGGVVRSDEHSLIGHLTESSIRQFRIDLCVIGVAGIDSEVGVTEYSLDDAAVKRAGIAQSRKLIVAADASKLGAIAFAVVAPVGQVDILVTSADPDHPQIKALEEAGVEIKNVREEE